MKDFKINFELKNINDIEPWGDTIHWFALTDGTLYIQVSDHKIYEYSDSARDFFKCDIKYNDYYLARFVTDFTELFRFIREPIPEILYDNIDKFEDITDLWKNMYEDKPDDIFDEFYFGEYNTLTEWYYMQHTLNSAHLVGGPHIGFFRYGDKIKILWKSYDDAILENGENIWTSPNGVYEMSWNDFTKEVEVFYLKFRRKMDYRTDYIYKHGLTHAQIDRELLVHSNSNNIIAFEQHLELLFSDDYEKTDFDRILFLYEKMRSEINEQELQEISSS
ncbi:MAG: DUF5984 family protein [Prevotella sp.]|nr:DUF5984 family protein [Alistipes senegalensis]MCM1357878.1 DUF5984 family protein [Prevotella sp.]MCM1473902.1 DUF5984 family protein [Muribaculaceae bacterium]